MGTRTLGQPGQFTTQGDASAVLGQSRAEHVGDVNKSTPLADGAIALDPTADLAGGTHKFGMSVADFAERQDAIAIVGEHCGASESVVDMAFGVSVGGRWHAKHSTSIVGRDWPRALAQPVVSTGCAA